MDNAPGKSELKKIGKTLEAMIKAGVEAKKDFDDLGDEVWKYAYSKDYEFLYQDWETANGELFFKAKISKAAQYIEVMGPYLYQYNPDYVIEPSKDVPIENVRRLPIEARYINWCAKQADQYTNCRRAVNEACGRGRGVVFTGYNTRKGCVANVHRQTKDVIDDPDAACPEERNWIAIRRRKPRWELANLYPKAREAVWDATKAKELPSQKRSKTSSKAVDVIEYYEIYMRVGIGRYAEGVGMDEQGQIQDSPMKFIVCEDEVLDILTWEIPFFRNGFDKWPVSMLDLRENPGSVYPALPLEPCLGLIRALNWSHTLILSQLQVSTRLAFVVMNLNGQKMETNQLLKILRGEHYDIAVLNQLGNEYPEIGKMIQQLEIKNSIPDLKVLNEMLSMEIEKTSGLYEILFAGQTPTQIRTAEDASLKDKNSRTRVDDMRSQTEKWATEIGSKTRFAARYLEGSQDIGRLFGPQAGQFWGDLANPQEVEAWQEARQQIAQQATQRIQMQSQMMGVPPPPPQVMQQMVQQQVDQVIPNELVDFDAWMLESDVSIESGSMRRKDIEDEIDSFQQAGNTIVPAMLANPNPAIQAIAMRIQARGLEVSGAPKDLVDDVNQAADILQATPPPMPQGPAGPPPGPGKTPKNRDERPKASRPKGAA